MIEDNVNKSQVKGIKSIFNVVWNIIRPLGPSYKVVGVVMRAAFAIGRVSY